MTAPKKKTIYHATKRLRDTLDRFVMTFSLLPDRVVFGPTALPWIRRIEAHWEMIRDEAIAIQTGEIPSLGDISPDHGRIAADRRWRSFFMEGYGYKRQDNRARVPRTARLLDEIPGLVTASFSCWSRGATSRAIAA